MNEPLLWDHPLVGPLLTAAERAYEWAEAGPLLRLDPAVPLREIGRYLTKCLEWWAEESKQIEEEEFANFCASLWTPEEIADLTARLMARCDTINDPEVRREYKMFMRAKINGLRCDALGLDLFEEWMVERFRAQLASEEYRATAEYAYMRAQWEREG